VGLNITFICTVMQTDVRHTNCSDCVNGNWHQQTVLSVGMLYRIQMLSDWHHSDILEGLAQVDCAQVGLEHTCGQLYMGGCTFMHARACVCVSSYSSEFSSQEPDQLQHNCSVPHVIVRQYSSTIFVTWCSHFCNK